MIFFQAHLSNFRREPINVGYSSPITLSQNPKKTHVVFMTHVILDTKKLMWWTSKHINCVANIGIDVDSHLTMDHTKFKNVDASKLVRSTLNVSWHT